MEEVLQENKADILPQQSWILQDLMYEVVQNDPEIQSQYTQEDLKKLLNWVSNIDITIFATQAIKWLLLELPKEIISNEIVITEISILKKADRKEIENEWIAQKTQSLRELYDTIDQKYKPNTQSPERKIFFSQQQKDINLMNILKKNAIDPNFYLQTLYTAEQLIKSKEILTPKAISFINQFNAFNKSLNIDHQITIPTEKIQVIDKPNNLSDIIASPTAVLAYPSVKEYTSKQKNILNSSIGKTNINPKMQQDIWTKLTPEQQENIRELIKKNCVDNQLLNQTDFNYTATIDIEQLLLSPNTINTTTKNDIQTIIDSVLWSYTQEYLIDQTNTQVKQLVITQALAGLASYFDTTTSPTDNYARDFNLNTWNISIENDTIHISWKMHGQIVHFFYNLQTGELQANDYLYKVMKAESFLINDIDWWRYTLPNALPTITDLQKTMKTINYTDLMEDNTSIDDYQNTIRQQSTILKEKFSTQTYNKLYITRTNEKNLFIQEALDAIGWKSKLLETIGGENTGNSIEITRSLHPNEYELLMLLDRTSYTYRSPEQLRIIRDCIRRLNTQIKSNRIQDGEHTDPLINKLFSQQSLLIDQDNPRKKSSFLNFFDLISTPNNQQWWWIINLTLLQNIIERIENNEPIAIIENPKPIAYQSDPWYFNEKYEKIA